METTTHVVDGVTFEVDMATCVNCGEQVGRANARGMRAWRHTATMKGMCASGESCAEVER